MKFKRGLWFVARNAPRHLNRNASKQLEIAGFSEVESLLKLHTFGRHAFCY